MKKREPRPPQHQDSPIQAAIPPPLETTTPPPTQPAAAPAALIWPADRPLPKTYSPPLVPCPYCRSVLLADHGKAVVCFSRAAGMVYFRCRACGRRFKLAVEKSK